MAVSFQLERRVLDKSCVLYMPITSFPPGGRVVGLFVLREVLGGDHASRSMALARGVRGC